MKVGGREWNQVVARLFGTSLEEVRVNGSTLNVSNHQYRIEHGVVLLDSEEVAHETVRGTAEDVRRSFSEEWKTYRHILPEHDAEFSAYFDLVDLESLQSALVIDLGCGSGRWSAKLARYCQAIVLVDFSDAIFVARENMADADNAIFFRGDVTNLPFVDSSVDLFFSLGVLHHLDQRCLPVARNLMRIGPRGLFYLYYALDNRPWYFKPILRGVTQVRLVLGRVESERARRRISRLLAIGVYRPMVALGRIVERLGLNTAVPLFETYCGKSNSRIEQDAYDRFFTSIEQRVSRRDIQDAFPLTWRIAFSESEPYWHFLVERPMELDSLEHRLIK